MKIMFLLAAAEPLMRGLLALMLFASPVFNALPLSVSKAVCVCVMVKKCKKRIPA
jgi:hypothetical protein